MWPNMMQQQESPILFPGADASKEALVEQIKQAGRDDPNAKVQWVAFTDHQGRGVKDPAKHTPEFLQEFLTHLASGVRLEPNPETDLSKAIKVLQRQSGPQFRQAWSNFCMMAGGGRQDPTKHEAEFHLQFFEALSQQALTNSGGGGGGMGPMPGMGMKRDASQMLGMGGAASAKDILTSRLKAFQRSTPENKELWSTYCDTYLGGIKDPNRHDEATLKEFCDNHGVPNESDMGPPVPAVLDPAMEMYVTKVKDFTKSGPEGKQSWLDFCGRHKDPARHPIEKLQEFCATYGL